jgi:hypothetical protein
MEAAGSSETFITIHAHGVITRKTEITVVRNFFWLVECLAYSLTWKIEVVSSYETSVKYYQSMRHHINYHRSESLKSVRLLFRIRSIQISAETLTLQAVFRDFPQPSHGSAGILPQIRPQLLPSTHFRTIRCRIARDTDSVLKLTINT